jgi:hypothetical protein
MVRSRERVKKPNEGAVKRRMAHKSETLIDTSSDDSKRETVSISRQADSSIPFSPENDVSAKLDLPGEE